MQRGERTQRANGVRSTEETLLLGVLAKGRGLLPEKLAMAALFAAGLWYLAGWPLAAGCLVVTCVGQGIELTFGEVALRAPPGSRRRAVMLRLAPLPLFLACVTFVVPAPVYWLAGGSMGPVVAVVMVLGSAQHVWLHFSAVPRMAAAGLGAFLAWLVALLAAGIALGGGSDNHELVGHAMALLSLVVMMWNLASSSRKTHRFAAQLAEAKQRAEAAAQSKSEFLAAMSHEIRTPMNGVIATAELLGESALTDEQRELVRVQIASGTALLAIINDVLDLSKLEAGKLTLNPAPIDPREVVRDAVALLVPQAREKGVTLEAVFGSGVPPCVLADAGRLRQALLNLAGNAVKFTDRGRVSVRVDARPRPEESKGEMEGWVRLRVEVADTGCGIPPDHLSRMFEPFEQSVAAGTPRREGTGLGLSITRRLVEAMDGQLGAESTMGEGSTFWFEASLPMGEAEPHQLRGEQGPARAAASALKAPAHSAGGFERPLVLLVEDNATNRQLFAAMARRYPIRLEVAVDGREGVERAQALCPDLVVSDISMPGMDGHGLARALRSWRAERVGDRSRPVLIAFTAHVLKDERLRCEEAGFEGFLGKPLRRAALDEMLWRTIGVAPAPMGVALEPRPALARPPKAAE